MLKPVVISERCWLEEAVSSSAQTAPCTWKDLNSNFINRQDRTDEVFLSPLPPQGKEKRRESVGGVKIEVGNLLGPCVSLAFL